MPWSRAKKLATEVRADPVRLAKELALFNACVRIGKEAECPTVIENVRGAIPWIGRSRANYGSFHLWGDVPALMPMTKAVKIPMPPGGDSLKIGFQQMAKLQMGGIKAPGMNWSNQELRGQDFTRIAAKHSGVKHGGDCFSDPSWPGKQGGTKQPGISGPRNNGKGDRWFQDGAARSGSKSNARKAASAAIAKIPFALAKYIARVYHPKHESDTNNTRPEVCTMDSS